MSNHKTTRTKPSTETENTTDEEHSTETESSTESVTVCEECGGDIIKAPERSERLCGDCGLVVESDMIDHGPEWRAFNSSERQSRSRVGPAQTNLQHDSGLSTSISWQNKDGNGKMLSAQQRQKMKRLRTWNKRSRIGSGGQRGVAYANGEIKRMGSAIGAAKEIQETAASLYRQAYEAGLIPGRSIEGVASAALYIALRVHDTPRSFDTIETVSRVDRKPIARAKEYLCRELNIPLEPTSPTQYLPQILTELDAPRELEQQANQLINDLEEHRFSGHDPTVLATGAIYAACVVTGKFITQTDIKNAADVTTVSIRNNYQQFLIHSDRYSITEEDFEKNTTAIGISNKLNSEVTYIES